jgi:hypothetical protein
MQVEMNALYFLGMFEIFTTSFRLQEYILHGAWNKALDILEKFKPSISEVGTVTL